MIKIASFLLILLASNLAQARTDVVKILSFSCAVCYASEAQDIAIASAVKAKGGKFIPAPVPAASSDTGDKEKFYYAAKNISPELGEKVKKAIYKGIQDIGVPLTSVSETYTWIQQEGGIPDSTLYSIAEDAYKQEATSSFTKAIGLAVNAGVTNLPAYIVLVNGKIVATIDPTNVPGNSLSNVRDAVISKINESYKD